MNAPVLTLCFGNLLAIGVLPRLFFRSGRLNPQWWLTTAPFVAAAWILLGGLAGLVRPVPLAADAAVLLASIAGLLATFSAGLMGVTLGSHRVPLSLWHQADDQPVSIVTWGPYAVVRHPFYVAYVLTFAAVFLAVPGPASAAVLVLGTLQLYRTARVEEGRLLDSAFGKEYGEYMRRTGRFIPRRYVVRARMTTSPDA